MFNVKVSGQMENDERFIDDTINCERGIGFFGISEEKTGALLVGSFTPELLAADLAELLDRIKSVINDDTDSPLKGDFIDVLDSASGQLDFFSRFCKLVDNTNLPVNVDDQEEDALC